MIMILITVGDLQRIRPYPARGFQIEQQTPDEAWDAFEGGFDTHLAGV
jgi:hypothetical protein